MGLCGNPGFVPAQHPEGSVLFPVVQMEEREKTGMLRGMKVHQVGQIYMDYKGGGDLVTHWDTGMSRQLKKWRFSGSREALACMTQN